MKKNVIKIAFAAICVVAAGVSGMKAYNAANQSKADMLLTENVEALSAGDGAGWFDCPWRGGRCNYYNIYGPAGIDGITQSPNW